MSTETILREPPRASGGEGENVQLDDLAVKYCPTHALSIEED